MSKYIGLEVRLSRLKFSLRDLDPVTLHILIIPSKKWSVSFTDFLGNSR